MSEVPARELAPDGRRDATEAALAALHAAHPEHPEVAGTYARLLVSRGRYREARAVALAAGPLRGERAEAAGLAALQLGELEAADAAFASLEASAADGAAAGRALGWRGCVAHRRGALGIASDRYREASQWLADAGDRPGAASAELELAAILVERGRISEALTRLAAVGRALGEGDRDRDDRARAALCATTALLIAGKLDDAHAAAADALAASREAPALHARALIGDGEVRRRLGDEPGALRRYHEALALATSRRDAAGQLRAQLALAEAGQPTDELPRDDDRAILARGRRALLDPSSMRPASGRGAAPSEAVLALAHQCVAVAVRATDSDRLERAFRGRALAAQLAHRAGDAALAHSEAARARVGHAAFAAVNAPALRPALDGDPDLARVVALAARAPILHVPEAPRAASPAAPATPGASLAAIASPPSPALGFDAQLASLLASLPDLADASLALRPALAAVEQAFVAAAMARANHNQTVAARMLGLSRFGLQKKLRRLASDAPDASDAED